jgi:hypothetical protein
LGSIGFYLGGMAVILAVVAVRVVSTPQRAIRLAVVTLPMATRGSVLLPKRWVVGSCAWAARFCRLARDDERRAETLTGLHLLAFAILLLHRFVTLMAEDAYHPLGAIPFR